MRRDGHAGAVRGRAALAVGALDRAVPDAADPGGARRPGQCRCVWAARRPAVHRSPLPEVVRPGGSRDHAGDAPSVTTAGAGTVEREGSTPSIAAASEPGS